MEIPQKQVFEYYKVLVEYSEIDPLNFVNNLNLLRCKIRRHALSPASI